MTTAGYRRVLVTALLWPGVFAGAAAADPPALADVLNDRLAVFHDGYDAKQVLVLAGRRFEAGGHVKINVIVAGGNFLTGWIGGHARGQPAQLDFSFPIKFRLLLELADDFSALALLNSGHVELGGQIRLGNLNLGKLR